MCLSDPNSDVARGLSNPDSDVSLCLSEPDISSGLSDPL